jgi:hypothetical protein
MEDTSSIRSSARTHASERLHCTLNAVRPNIQFNGFLLQPPYGAELMSHSQLANRYGPRLCILFLSQTAMFPM